MSALLDELEQCPDEQHDEPEASGDQHENAVKRDAAERRGGVGVGHGCLLVDKRDVNLITILVFDAESPRRKKGILASVTMQGPF